MNERMDGWMDGYRGMMIKKLYDRCWTGAGWSVTWLFRELHQEALSTAQITQRQVVVRKLRTG